MPWLRVAGALAIGALFLRPGSAAAEERAVRIACGELDADDTAEVEARVQSSLLVVGAANIQVLVECHDESARVTAHAGERSETRDVPLPQTSLADALVAASESALDALLQQRSGASASFPSEPLAQGKAQEPENALPAASASSSEHRDAGETPGSSETGGAANEPAFRLGAGVLGESFQGTLAGGGRLVAEYGFGAPVVGIVLGVVTLLGNQDDFSAIEWHGEVFGGYEPRGLGGVRGTVGVGTSFFNVAPNADVVARSDTSVASVFGELAISRPTRVGKLIVVPAFDLRFFPWARTVNVDGEESMSLSGVNLGLFLGVLYEL